MRLRKIWVAAAGAGLGLSACGIGEGIRLDAMSIVPVEVTTGTATVASTRIFRCVRDQLRAFGTFSDGEVGDYTSRVRWSSSDESIVHVSNADPAVDAVPGTTTGLVFSAGTLTPIAAGTATVSLEYVGLRQQIAVTVAGLADDQITISPANPSIAPGSLAGLRINAILDGRTSDITATAAWAFTNPDDTVATIDAATGVVSGVSTTGGGPLTARASFTACDAAPTTDVTVKPVQNLLLQKELAVDSLIVNTSQKLTVLADFGDGTQQDLSTQATYCIAPDTQTFIAFYATPSIRNYVLATNAGGPVGIQAIFPPLSSFTVPEGAAAYSCSNSPPADQLKLSNPLALTAAAARLCSIAVTAAPPAADPKNASIAFNQTQQFTALGTFTTATIDDAHPAADACADAASRVTQDITRHVTWTSSDATIAVIATPAANFAGSGLSAGIKAEGGTVTITAVAEVALAGALAQVAGDDTATLTIVPVP